MQDIDQLLLENQKLKRAIEELSTLNDLARAIGASRNSQDVMNTIIRRSLRAVHAEQGLITLVSKNESDPLKTLVRDMSSSSQHQPFHVHQNLLGWMQLNKKYLMINNPHSDGRFRGIKWDETIQNLLCVPLMVKSELVGILTVTNKKGSLEFTDDDQRLLSIIAAQSAQVVENARLYEEEQALIHMQEEVRLASIIQHDLLPKEFPQIQGYDIAGKSIAAQKVGGDYFDFIKIDEHRIAVCLGDVSGKGLPAAILMANLQATIRSQALLDVTAKDCTTRSNKLLFRNTDMGKFVTFFYGILCTQENKLCFSNAGHDNPYLFKKSGEILRLKTGGIVLGFVENVPFEQESVSFDSGDMLVVYSDGITEAMNAEQEEFEEEALVEVIQKYKEEPANKIIDEIISSVKQHAGITPQMDDMTLVVVKRE